MANAHGTINDEVAIGTPVDDQQQQKPPDASDNQTTNYDPAQNIE